MACPTRWIRSLSQSLSHQLHSFWKPNIQVLYDNVNWVVLQKHKSPANTGLKITFTHCTTVVEGGFLLDLKKIFHWYMRHINIIYQITSSSKSIFSYFIYHFSYFSFTSALWTHNGCSLVPRQTWSGRCSSSLVGICFSNVGEIDLHLFMKSLCNFYLLWLFLTKITY